MISQATRLRRALALAAAFALAVPSVAHAHSAFLTSTPAPGERLQDAPARVVLRFTEPLNARLSRAELVPARGGSRVEARIARSGRTLSITPAARLGRGAYRLEWHTVSTEDGHALEGSFSFGVRAAAVGGGHAIEQSPLARRGWLRIGFRAAIYAALLLFAGAVLLRVLLPDREGRSWLAPRTLDDEFGDGAAADRRVRALVGDVGVFAASCAVAVALLDAADAAGGLSLSGVSDFLLANLPGVARIALVLLILGAVVLVERARRVAAALVVLAVGAIAVSGHANSAEPRFAAIVNDWAHLLAAAVWVGGIALIAITWGPVRRTLDAGARRAAMRHVLPAFGRIALAAFVLVVVSGSVSALIELGEPQALWQTAYGRILTVKVVLAALIALLSYAHAMRLRPRLMGANPHPRAALERRHWRLLAAEPLVGLGVVIAVAVLVAFPLPPRQLGELEPASAAPAACDPCPLPRSGADELAVAAQGGRNIVAAWIRRRPEGLAGEVRLIDIRGRASRTPIRILGTVARPCGAGCHRFTAPAGDTLTVVGRDQGVSFTATLPARWLPDRRRSARRLLERAQRTMRALRSLRETERVTSGPGTLARTDYRLKAPDRVALTTDRGLRRAEIGRRRWFRAGDTSWQIERSDAGLPFRMRTWFRWTAFAQAVQLLRLDRSRRRAELALFDPGTPAWQRLTVDLRTLRVTAAITATKAHFSTQRFYAFNRPVRIDAPKAVTDAP